jgi:hypothetical protein
MAMPRNLQRRPAKPTLGNGRIQRAVRRAFYFGSEVTSRDVYDWVYPRVAAFVAVAAMVLLVWRPTFDVQIKPPEIIATTGFAFAVRVRDPSIPGYILLNDSVANDTASSLMLFENDTGLGPPHVIHETIRQRGSGTFSH